MASESVMHEKGHLKLVLWDNTEGWSGREVGFWMVGHLYIPG